MRRRRNRTALARREDKKPEKKVELKSYGQKDKTGTKGDEAFITKDCLLHGGVYGAYSTYDRGFHFMGRLKFGTKSQLQQIAQAFNAPFSRSFTEAVGVLVVDDINRTDLVTMDKAREKGILIISEEEFLYLISSNKKEVEIKYNRGDINEEI